MIAWLCVTIKGVRVVNSAAVSQLDPPTTEDEIEEHGYPTDP